MTSKTDAITALKAQKKAIILAHYYQPADIQRVADYVGDSYYLSKVARDSDSDFIVFCGVQFMAESAKILSPHKTVVLPVADAGCPMADMVDVSTLRDWKQKHPDAAVVCYINSHAQAKALCDVCVTSSNALGIIRKLPQEKIIFAPDQNLSAWIARQCPEKTFISWPGFCCVHNNVKPEQVLRLKAAHPDAPVAAHPECRQNVLDLADFVGSTAGILKYAGSSPALGVIIVTEEGLRYMLETQNPHKDFYFPSPSMICGNMKKTTLDDVVRALETETTRIQVDEDVRLAALGCLQEMHRLAG